jgi:hypothetical protein
MAAGVYCNSSSFPFSVCHYNVGGAFLKLFPSDLATFVSMRVISPATGVESRGAASLWRLCQPDFLLGLLSPLAFGLKP